MTRKTGLIVPPTSLGHDTGPGHPEHAGRIRALESAVEEAWPSLESRVELMEAVATYEQDLLAVHSREHLEHIREAWRIACERQVLVGLDPDTRVSPGSWDAALMAAGGAVTAAQAVGRGAVKNAFVGARPPGHHATPGRAMGFCLFNNVAVAARWLQSNGMADRVLIVDWDVHHGNGTQDAFYTDPSVCYVSLHQWPHYPGSGAAEETGAGEGIGYTVNVPLPAFTAPEAYKDRFEDALDRATSGFTPDFVLVSAGFDVMAGDPLGGQMLEPADLADLTRSIGERAGGWCNGRVVALLEGGYAPERIGQGAVAVLAAMSETKDGRGE